MGPVASKTLARSITSFTGRPDFFERTAASGSRYTAIFPPNPPPISIGTTLIREIGTPSSPPSWSRAAKAPCVLVQTVMCPSAFQWAVALCGSI